MRSHPLFCKLLAHVVASYAGMLALDVLAWELDHRVYQGLPLKTAIAPVAAPWLVVMTALRFSHFKLLLIPCVLIPYLAAFFAISLLLKRRATPKGFPVLPTPEHATE